MEDISIRIDNPDPVMKKINVWDYISKDKIPFCIGFLRISTTDLNFWLYNETLMLNDKKYNLYLYHTNREQEILIFDFTMHWLAPLNFTPDFNTPLEFTMMQSSSIHIDFSVVKTLHREFEIRMPFVEGESEPEVKNHATETDYPALTSRDELIKIATREHYALWAARASGRESLIIDRCLDFINNLQKTRYQEITTVHFNACVQTINACIKQWNVDLKDKILPAHPPIDTLKK